MSYPSDLYGNYPPIYSFQNKDPLTLGRCLTAPHLECGEPTEGASRECFMQNECLPKVGSGGMPGDNAQFDGASGRCMLTGDDCVVGGEPCQPQARCVGREEWKAQGYTFDDGPQGDRCFQSIHCQNGGTCENGACQCKPGYEGWKCETRTAEVADTAAEVADTAAEVAE